MKTRFETILSNYTEWSKPVESIDCNFIHLFVSLWVFLMLTLTWTNLRCSYNFDKYLKKNLKMCGLKFNINLNLNCAWFDQARLRSEIFFFPSFYPFRIFACFTWWHNDCFTITIYSEFICSFKYTGGDKNGDSRSMIWFQNL